MKSCAPFILLVQKHIKRTYPGGTFFVYRALSTMLHHQLKGKNKQKSPKAAHQRHPPPPHVRPGMVTDYWLPFIIFGFLGTAPCVCMCVWWKYLAWGWVGGWVSVFVFKEPEERMRNTEERERDWGAGGPGQVPRLRCRAPVTARLPPFRPILCTLDLSKDGQTWQVKPLTQRQSGLTCILHCRREGRSLSAR